MRSKTINTFLLLLILYACGRDHTKDQSLTLDAYTKMGIPDPNVIWDSEDFSMAFLKLSELKWKQPFQLPMKDSRKSNKLFQRLVSHENMAFMQDERVPRAEKAYRLLDYLRVYEDLTDLYTDPRLKLQYYHRELIEINIQKIMLAQKMLDLGAEIRKSKDPGDVMMSRGYSSIRENYLSIVHNTLLLQSKPFLFLDSDLNMLSDTIHNSLVGNQSWLDSVSTDELKQTLQMAIDSAATDHVQKRYVEVYGLL
jgi:hypothetical protein